ncbi:phage tail protein [Providencia rettgeri]
MASVITTAFENWKAQEAASGKTVLLDEFVFANVPNLDPTKPIDRNEKLPPANQIVHRQAVNKAGLASENAVAYSVTMGTEVGNFDFNWIGLLNKASGTVAMITHAPTQKKLKTQNGQQGNVLTRSFLLEFQGAAEETQIKTSAETWQIDFTARLSGIDEMQRLINVDSYGAAAFFNDGFEVTRSGEQYTVKKGLGYVGGLRGELAQNQILNGLRNTKVYADFSYQGNIVSKWNTVVKITSAATLNNYVDAAGFTHQVFAIASIDANGNVKDLRPMGALSSQEISALEARFKLDLSKKIDKGNITSQTGNSTELVVNQHLLTTELGKKQPAGNYALVGYSYSKIESDTNYQPKGDYATNTALTSGLANKFDKTGGKLSGGIAATGISAEKIDSNHRASIYPPIDDNENSLAYFQYNLGSSWFGRLLIPKAPSGQTISLLSSDNIVQVTGNSTSNIISQKGVTDLANTKFDKSSVVQSVGTSEINVISQKALTNALIGFNQKFEDVKSQRKKNVLYTNSTSKPIYIMVSVSSLTTITGVDLLLYIDGAAFKVIGGGSANNGTFKGAHLSAIIPPSSTYKIESSFDIESWGELR